MSRVWFLGGTEAGCVSGRFLSITGSRLRPLGLQLQSFSPDTKSLGCRGTSTWLMGLTELTWLRGDSIENEKVLMAKINSCPAK